MATFDSGKEHLEEMLKSIHSAKIQLPDFQRGWVWEDERIRALLASVSKGFPVGAVMTLETGNPDVKLHPRCVEGVEAHGNPESLILDGQQRLTSLYQAIYRNKPVTTKDPRKKRIRRWYYLDIRKALDPRTDREEAIVSVPEDKLIKDQFGRTTIVDLTSVANETKAQLFPLNILFDQEAFNAWQMQYLSVPPEELKDQVDRWNRLNSEVLQHIKIYQLPVIRISKEAPKEAVCLVFEKVNTGGVSLDVFELLTATYAADNFQLRKDWANREERFKEEGVLDRQEKSDFLQIISLLHTIEQRKEHFKNGGKEENAPGISCKKEHIMRLPLSAYQKWADVAESALKKIVKFLHRQKIFSAHDVPYRTQLVPLAGIYALLGDETEKDSVVNRIARWYWCGVLGELYGGAIETRFAKDVPEVVAWIQGGSEPSTIEVAGARQSRLYSLRTRNSAAYKGIYALLMRDGALDFRSGDAIEAQHYFDENIDIHHIFPRKWYHEAGIEDRIGDSIINKTPLSAKTNRIIGGRAPSKYVERLEKDGIKSDRLDNILTTHLIDPALLRADKFDEFIKARESALITRIENAMGKPVARDLDAVGGAPPAETEDFEEDEEDVA